MIKNIRIWLLDDCRAAFPESVLDFEWKNSDTKYVQFPTENNSLIRSFHVHLEED